jgi:phosphocarrier protein HPr
MISRIVRVENELGLHARAAARLVKLASGFHSEVRISRANGQQQTDGKSILGILLLAAANGTELEVVVEGSDEERAMEEIVRLISNKFDEER